MKKKHVPPGEEFQSPGNISSAGEVKPIKRVDNQDSFQMSSLGKSSTGLPMIIWVSEKYARLVPRIKVSKGYHNKIRARNRFSVSILEPKIIAGDQGHIKDSDLDLVYKWVTLNRDALLKHWNLEYSTGEMINGLKKLP